VHFRQSPRRVLRNKGASFDREAASRHAQASLAGPSMYCSIVHLCLERCSGRRLAQRIQIDQAVEF